MRIAAFSTMFAPLSDIDRVVALAQEAGGRVVQIDGIHISEERDSHTTIKIQQRLNWD